MIVVLCAIITEPSSQRRLHKALHRAYNDDVTKASFVHTTTVLRNSERTVVIPKHIYPLQDVPINSKYCWFRPTEHCYC